MAAVALIGASPLMRAASIASTAGDLDAAGTAAEECKPLQVVSRQPVISSDGLVATGYTFDFGQLTTALSIVPPAGWSPVNAPANELAAFGFPARPTDPTALADWTSEWQHYTGTSTPDLCVWTNRRFGSTPSWAGMELATTTRNSYFAASGRFNEPTWLAACPHASDHAIWTGIGGDEAVSDPGLIQTGVDADQSGLNVDQGFFELIQDVNNPTHQSDAPVKYDTSPSDATPWTVNPGDAIRANVQYRAPGAVGNTTGTITLSLFDITTGVATPPEVITYWYGAPAYTFVHGHTAEWVDVVNTSGGFYDYWYHCPGE